MPGVQADVLQGARVLLVEDDADIRDVLTQMLSDEGVQVSSANNGREALTTLQRGVPPDVIVLDLMMPVMDGWQFRLEQKKDPTLASIPVVAMSADASAKAEAIDVDAYVRKPLEFNNLLGRIRHVVEQTRTQRLAAANRIAALGTLAAGIAHEVNNPLAYTMCNIQHLLEKVPPLLTTDRTEVQQLLAEALEGARRIAQVVKQAQMVSPARPEENGVTDVRAAAEAVIQRLQRELRQRAVLVASFDGHPRVTGDRGRIEQIFTNLLRNAIQSLPEDAAGENQIRVRARQLPSDRVLIEISDTGCGIPAEVQERIFQPFFTTRPIGEGPGLGLSICQGIVTALGGEVSFESEVGRGSTFRVILPTTRRPVPDAESATEVEMAPVGAEVWPGGRILVIDEEPIMMRAVKYMLGPGHEVAFANSSEEALAILDEGARFDAVLCDFMLRNGTGMAFANAIARKHPALEERVVFMSAGAVTPEAQRFLDTGRYRCIEKPFDRKQLLQAISTRGPLPAGERQRDLDDDDQSRSLQRDVRPVQSNR
jgi:signal transduction histidine kinase